MPAPVNPNAIIVAGFDPEKHCGATNRRGEICMNAAGWGTAYPNDPTRRCKMHGGSSNGRPIKHGLYSRRDQLTFRELIDDIRENGNLTDLSTELAIAKANIDRVVQSYEVALEMYQKALDAWTEDPETNPFPAAPELDLSLLDKIARLAATQHNIETDRENIITPNDLKGVLNQIKLAFDEVCREFGVPEAAARKFGARLQEIRFKGRDRRTSSEGADERSLVEVR